MEGAAGRLSIRLWRSAGDLAQRWPRGSAERRKRAEQTNSVLRDRFGVVPDTAEQTIETVLASPQVARLLDADPGVPVLLLTRTTKTADGTPFEFVRSVYRGDRYRFAATLNRF